MTALAEVTARAPYNAAAFIEDVEFLLASGAAADEIARRMGITTHCASKRCRDAGRQDLAAPFDTCDMRERA